MPDHVGQQFGTYKLLRLLGQGGFAEVYLGEHIYLNTQAAIKIMHTHLGTNDLQSFLSEARIIANLKHPHIVPVLEFDVRNEQPFLVMGYAPNGTLRQRYPAGTRLDNATLLSAVKPIAAALQYAHEQNVVHRDVKPENMLFGSRDEVLLSDFGIAVISQSTNYQTKQDIGGTIAYMAPEQLQGKARPASDQYALGITVYEWLCGERPFKGGFAEIGSQHLFVPPPSLRERVPGISPRVEQVVFTALAKDPTQRFATIQAFANALEDALQGTATFAPSSSLANSPVMTPPPPPGVSPGYPLAGQPLSQSSPSHPVVGQPSQSLPTHPASAWPSHNPAHAFPPPQSTLTQTIPAFPQQRPDQMFPQRQSTFTQTVPTFPQQRPARNGGRIAAFAMGALLVLALLLKVGLTSMNSFTHQQAGKSGAAQQQNGATGNSPSGQTAPTATPTPSPTPVAPGTVLYQADWSKDGSGWTGSRQWKAFGNGQVGSDGSDQKSFCFWAPNALPTHNYSVEAHVQFVRPNFPAADTTYGPNNYEFGILVRGDGLNNGYEIGMGDHFYSAPDNLYARPNGALVMRVNNDNIRNELYMDGLTQTKDVLGSKKYTIDNNWHTYRVEVSGNSIKFFLDNALVVETTDNNYIDGVHVGLRAVFATVNVSDFKVKAL